MHRDGRHFPCGMENGSGQQESGVRWPYSKLEPCSSANPGGSTIHGNLSGHGQLPPPCYARPRQVSSRYQGPDLCGSAMLRLSIQKPQSGLTYAIAAHDGGQDIMASRQAPGLSKTNRPAGDSPTQEQEGALIEKTPRMSTSNQNPLARARHTTTLRTSPIANAGMFVGNCPSA